MKNFILRLLAFSIPFCMIIPIELSVRENTYKVKSEYVEKNKNDIYQVLKKKYCEKHFCVKV